jgi:hypothetical protein
MSIFDLVCGIGDFLSSWRFYLCALPTVLAAIWIQDHFADAHWMWPVTISLVIVGVGGGLIWEWSHHDDRKP